MNPRILLPGSPNRYHRYCAALEASGGTAVCSLDPDALESCQGLLLPGGGDLDPQRYGASNTQSLEIEPEREALEWVLVERSLRQGKPILGICRGMQLLNVFFGGTLHQDLPGHRTAQGIDRLHWVDTTPGPLRALCGTRCLVNSAHHQAVDRLGAELIPVQFTPDGTIEALVHESLPLLGLQWHPERLDPRLPNAPNPQRIFSAFLDGCRDSGPFPELFKKFS